MNDPHRSTFVLRCPDARSVSVSVSVSVSAIVESAKFETQAKIRSRFLFFLLCSPISIPGNVTHSLTPFILFILLAAGSLLSSLTTSSLSTYPIIDISFELRLFRLMIFCMACWLTAPTWSVKDSRFLASRAFWLAVGPILL